MIYPCGCENILDVPSGIVKNAHKCSHHLSKAGRGGMDYYRSLNAVGKNTAHVQEFKDSLDSMYAPLEPAQGVCLEVGAGTGVYCPWVREMGYEYGAIEPDPEAADALRTVWDAKVYEETFEEFFEEFLATNNPQVDLLIATHVIEHFRGSPAMVQAMFDLLKPGGRALFLIPDDTDPVNPDHLWFYTPTSFHSLLARVGFMDIRTMVRRITTVENFIYASAYKGTV